MGILVVIWVVSLPGVVVGGGVGWVLGGGVGGSVDGVVGSVGGIVGSVGGIVGSALHPSVPQQSTLQDSRSPVSLRLLHTNPDEQRTGGKHTLTLISVKVSISFLIAVTVEQLKPGSQGSRFSSVAQSSSQMKHCRGAGDPLLPSVKTNWFITVMAVS